MSDVSFIRAAPPHSAHAPRRPADAPEAPRRETKRPERSAAPAELPSKTKVQTEQIAKYAYGYTFIDADTEQVVGRYPAESFVNSRHSAETIV
jgi:hypothetical protein